MNGPCAQWWQPLATQGFVALCAVLYAITRWIDRRDARPSTTTRPTSSGSSAC